MMKVTRPIVLVLETMDEANFLWTILNKPNCSAKELPCKSEHRPIPDNIETYDMFDQLNKQLNA